MDKPPRNVIPLFGAKPEEPPRFVREVTVHATSDTHVRAMAQALRDVADGLERGLLQYTAGGLTITSQPIATLKDERAVVIDGHLVLRQYPPQL